MAGRVSAPKAGLVPSEWESGPLFSGQTKDGAMRRPMRAWRPLFDGKTLDGWTVEDNKDLWVVEDGAIHCLGRGSGYLRSVEQFDDFSLALEFKIDKGVNSGVFVRWSDIKDPVNTGLEVQVIDSVGATKPGKHDAGAIYDLVPASRNTLRPIGEWNQLTIFAQGPYISSRLNGAKVAEIDVSRYTAPSKNPDGSANKFKYALASLPRRGYLGLQNHGGSVWYRNILLTPLKSV